MNFRERASGLAVKTGGEELLQPRGEYYDSHILLQTDLFENTGVLAPDAEKIRCNMSVKGPK